MSSQELIRNLWYPISQKPIGYHWVLVTSKREGTQEKWPLAFARYEDNSDKWNFFYTEQNYLECPVDSDYTGLMWTHEITHWMYFPCNPEE